MPRHTPREASSLGHLQPLCPPGGVFSASWGGRGEIFGTEGVSSPSRPPIGVHIFFFFSISVSGHSNKHLLGMPTTPDSSSPTTTPGHPVLPPPPWPSNAVDGFNCSGAPPSSPHFSAASQSLAKVLGHAASPPKDKASAGVAQPPV